MNYKQIVNQMHQEGAKQGYSIYGGACLALHAQGWRTKRLTDLLTQIRHDWNICAKDTSKSAVLMLYESTGIELRPPGVDKGIDELDWLNGKSANRTLTEAQLYYMRSQQIKWMRCTVMAMLFLALHERYGYGAERLTMLMDRLDRYSNLSSQQMIHKVKEVTGIDLPIYTG